MSCSSGQVPEPDIETLVALHGRGMLALDGQGGLSKRGELADGFWREGRNKSRGDW